MVKTGVGRAPGPRARVGTLKGVRLRVEAIEALAKKLSKTVTTAAPTPALRAGTHVG